MKLVSMHKVDPSVKPGAPVDPKLVEGMGALIGEMARQGVLLGGEGLKDHGTRARVSFSRGERRLEKSPYAGRNEVVSGLCLLRAASLDEAAGFAGRIAQALGDGVEVEVGPVTEPWDLGMPAPTPLPTPRFLALAKADELAESGTPFLPRIAPVLEELKRGGALIMAEGLTPSRQGKRVTQRKDRRKIVDGPFSESKELIGGYVVMQVASWDEALSWGERFAAVLGKEVEMDLRPVG